MNQEPLVSILTPSFNQDKYIQANLDSVSQQDYGRVEHVVMDGGSTDGTIELLRAAAESNSRLSWRSEPDRGQAHALGKAFEMSTGSIVGWLNSDDAYVAENTIRKVVKYFADHPGIDIVYGHSAWIGADGQVLLLRRAPKYSLSRLRRYDFICQPAAFMRRSSIESGFVDESMHFAMDYELWLRLGSLGHEFGRINEVVAVDREHAARKTGHLLEEYARNHATLKSKYHIAYGDHWYGLMLRLRGWSGRLSGLTLIGNLPRRLVYGGRSISAYRLLARHLFTSSSVLRDRAHREAQD